MIQEYRINAAMKAGREEAAAWRVIEFREHRKWLVTDSNRIFETVEQGLTKGFEALQFDSQADARGFIEYRAMEKAIEAAMKGQE